MSKKLLGQSLILVICLVLIGLQVARFPFPSPAIAPLLGPRDRWPTEMVMAFIESETPPKSFLEFFNRDPERTVPPGGNLVAPADGVIKRIVRRPEQTHFVVGLSFWDVHVVRTPVAGRVLKVEEEGVAIFRERSETDADAYLDGKLGPVQKVIWIETDDGLFKLRLITSWWASRLKVSAYPGKALAKGERVGRILLGSSVVVDTPPDVEFRLQAGERVIAGETIIAGDLP